MLAGKGRWRIAAILAAVALAAGACGGDDDDADTVASSTTSTAAASSSTSTTALETDPTDDQPDRSIATDAEGEPIDFLTYGRGAFPVRYDPDTQGVLSRSLLDGRIGYEVISSSPVGPDAPLSVIVELPAVTRLAEFGIPPMSTFGCCYGTHVQTVTVEVSATGADDGYETVASFDVDPDAAEDQRFAADPVVPGRWVRVTVEGRQQPDPDDYRGTSVIELHGYGSQDSIEVADGTFTGRWLTGGGGGGDAANRIELIQDGPLVVGCGTAGGASYTVSGGVENGLLRYVIGADTVPKVAVINSEDQLVGAEIGRSFGRIIGTPGGAETDCSPTVATEPPNPITDALDACSTAVVYGINFDVDDDTIRSDAAPAIDQIVAALRARADVAVVVEGHTDGDGSDAYNLDLSNRRAASVVAAISGQGVDGARLSSVGKGEAEPIADNGTDAGKAANRRVEIEPQC